MVALSEPGNPGGQDTMDVTLNPPSWTGRSRCLVTASINRKAPPDSERGRWGVVQKET